MKRHVIEGTWSGYRPSQSRVIHRVVTTNKALVNWVERTHAIHYTDGTMLRLAVRDARPRERVKEIHGYDKLITECAMYDVTSVAALPSKEKR